MKNSLTILLFIGALLLTALSSCSTQPPVKSGHALIEIDRTRDSKARILDPRIVSVNGRAPSSTQRQVQLPEGPQEVRIRFALRGGEDHDARLRFKARANERYSVHFVPYPRPVSEPLKDYARKWLVPTQGSAMDVFLLPVTLTGMFVDKKLDSVESRSAEVEWAYIRVFSSDETAGAIAEVRVP